MIKKLSLLCGGLATAGFLAAIGLADQKEQLQVPAGAEKTAEVAPRLVKLGSAKTIPNRAPEGGYTAPVTFAPTAEQFAECTIIDGNEDGKTWSFEDGYFKCTYSYSLAMDDWCILPAVNLEAGTYKVTYTYKTRGNKENFRMCFGNAATPESMTITIMEKTGYSNSSDVTESRTVDVPSDGQWHIGLYSFSDANMFYTYFKDITIEKLSPNQPTAPALSVEATGLDCALSVTLPTQTLGGDPLTAESITAKVSLDGQELDNGTVTGAPGSSAVINFNVGQSGNHNISARAYAGDLYSEPATVEHKFSKLQPVPIPLGYVFEPDNDEFDWCTVINANNDQKTWEYATSGYPTGNVTSEGTFRYTYDWSNPGDDWIILPAFEGTTAGARKLTFNVATKYNNEGLEVCMAYEPTVEALSQNVIWKNASFQSPESFTTQEAIFPVDGREFYIAFHAISPVNASYIYLQNIFVDETDGSAPQASTLSDPTFYGGDGTVTLTFPADNLAGSPMEPSTLLHADITLDGEDYGESITGAPGESKPIEFTGLALGNHTVTSTTYILQEDGSRLGKQTSELSFKCTLSPSFAYSLPLELALTKDAIDYFQIINANDDSSTWTGTDQGFQYKWNSSEPADDWFITPAIEVTEGGKLYDIAINAKCQSTSNPEAFEVFIGREQSVEGMTIPVFERTTVSNDDWRLFEQTIQLEEAGRYFIGVHCVSDKNMYYLYVNKLTMKESAANLLTPAAVTDLAGDGLETGELFADVTFKFPLINNGGDALEAETALTATVKSSTETKTVEGKPGEEASLRIACPEGKSVVSVIVSSELGEGPSSSIEVNCGLDRPTAPVITALTVAEDNMSVKIDYQAITTGASGGHVNPEGIDYYLWEWDADDEDWYQVDVTDALTMTYELEYANAPLTMLTLGLQAYNGLNSGSSMTSFTVVLGTPYTLPMDETFENGSIHYQPLALGSSLGAEYSPIWSITDPSTILPTAVSEEGGFALCGHTSWNRGDSFIYLPKFSTEGLTDAEIEFSSYHHPHACEMTLMAAGYGMDEYTVLGSVEIPQTTEGWKKFKYTLPDELQGLKWVDARLHVNFLGGSSSTPMIDSYSVRSASQSGVNVAAVGNAVSVEGKTGAILFTGLAGQTARVFAPAGLQVASTLLSADIQSVPVAPGIYVVTVGEKTFKVAVN